MNIIALIQARMGSTRLPCKTLLSLHGKPVIDWITERTKTSKRLQKIVVATSTNPNNDPLVYHLNKQEIPVYRGDEYDVLSRFYEAALLYKATHIVRICADNPLVWGQELDALIEEYLAKQQTPEGCDYAYNHIPRNNLYPDGIGGEIISFDLLEQLHTTVTLPAHREHCLSHIWENKRNYTIHTFNPADPLLHRPKVKLDMDTEEDYRFLATLPLHCMMPPQEVLALCPDSR